MSHKNSQEYIEKSFEEAGCKLLGKYENAIKKMQYRCSCGRESLISWNKFSQGRRCGFCGKRSKKYSIEEIKKIFEMRACVLLEEKYENHRKPLRYMCKCKKEAKISLNAFIYQNQTCIRCAGLKRSGENNHMWITDRELLKINLKFRTKCRGILNETLKSIKKEKSNKTKELLGYSPKKLMTHIMNHPNWDQVKLGKWHLDHIFPIKAFIDHGIKDIALINCLENLRPLSAEENFRKNARYNEAEFLQWIKSKSNT